VGIKKPLLLVQAGVETGALRQSINFFSVGREISALVAEPNTGSKGELLLKARTFWIGAEILLARCRTIGQRSSTTGAEQSVRADYGMAMRTNRH
jgi:hypothetical protein